MLDCWESWVSDGDCQEQKGLIPLWARVGEEVVSFGISVLTWRAAETHQMCESLEGRLARTLQMWHRQYVLIILFCPVCLMLWSHLPTNLPTSTFTT